MDKMDKSNEIRNEAAAAVGKIVQSSVRVIFETNKEFATQAAVHMGCNSALTSLICIVPYLAKKPPLTDKEIRERGAAEVAKLINPDVVLFAALVTANMHVDVKAEIFDVNDGNNFTGVKIEHEVNFGPLVMARALEAWKKLTGKDPKEIIDPHLIEAIEQCERESLAPFEDFLKGRTPAPSSKTLQ